jgi:hypothetical protein
VRHAPENLLKLSNCDQTANHAIRIILHKSSHFHPHSSGVRLDWPMDLPRSGTMSV